MFPIALTLWSERDNSRGVTTRRPKKGPQPGKRRFPRRRVSMWAQVDGAMRHPVLNLSEGGLFLLCETPMPVGHELAIELPLPERTIRASGRVVHATATEEVAGNGIMLTKIEPADVEVLHHFLENDAFGTTPSL